MQKIFIFCSRPLIIQGLSEVQAEKLKDRECIHVLPAFIKLNAVQSANQ